MSQTLASRMGTTAHLSPLLHKAKHLGMRSPEDLEYLAVSRGLYYFGSVDSSKKIPFAPAPAHFTNEELAIALLSPALPYSMNRIRMAAALLGGEGISAEKILRLSRLERCEIAVRHITEAAAEVEPLNPFWQTLLAGLPSSPSLAPDILPHLSRFVAMSGIGRTGRSMTRQWVRPTP